MSFREGFVAYRFDPNALTRTGLNYGHEIEQFQTVGAHGTVDARPGPRHLVWLEGDAEELAPYLLAINQLLGEKEIRGG